MLLLAIVAVLTSTVGDGDGVLAATTPCQVVTIFSLKTSDCERLGLTSVPVDLDTDLKVMRLADNRIATLRDDAFSVYSTLQELYLARNRIVVVSQNAFRGLPNLQIVDLSSNRLTVIRAEFLHHLTSVRSLSFASNPIIVVEPTALRLLVRLECVSFASGRLTRLDAHLFTASSRLTEIDVSGNRLTNLPADMEHHLPTALRVFRFYGNPWTCNCRLRWLRRWTATRPAVNWDFARNTPTCAAPPLLRSVSWKHLDVDQFACPSSVLVNSSTSVQLTSGGNASIECLAFGDPVPIVSWYKDSQELHNESARLTVSADIHDVTDARYVISHVSLRHVTNDDAGNYKCVAENSAGRSEVTFKAWLNSAGDRRTSDDRPATGDSRDGGSDDTNGIKTEVFVGVSLGAVVVIVAVVASCVVCALRRRQPCQRKYAYYVRDHHDKQPSASTHAASSCIRRLVARGRRLFRTASTVENHKDGEDGAARVCSAADDDDDDDDSKFVSSTLQSLLEAKQLFDESLPQRLTPDDKNERLLHSNEVEKLKEESNLDKSPCSCADHEVLADDSTSKTDSDQTTQDAVKEPAPDLLTGDGHTFRRGGVARSPYRRSKPKVSFADCRSPSSDFMSGDSTSSQMSSTPRRQAASSDDGADIVSSSVLRELSRHSCCVVELSDSSPTCSSSRDDTSQTRVESVRRSYSSNVFSASKVPPPSMPLSRTIQERRRLTAAGGHNEVDVDDMNIALPSTISGFTDGLFPPTKPVRTQQWRASGEYCSRFRPRFSEPTIRRTPRNTPPRKVTHDTEV